MVHEVGVRYPQRVRHMSGFGWVDDEAAQEVVDFLEQVTAHRPELLSLSLKGCVPILGRGASHSDHPTEGLAPCLSSAI